MKKTTQQNHRLPTAKDAKMLERQLKNLTAEGFLVELVTCPKCELTYRLAVPPEMLEIKCPSCRHKFVIADNKANE